MLEVLDFLAELTQHIPPKEVQLIRWYGLYSSRIKGRWPGMLYIAKRSPVGWKAQYSESEETASNADFDPFPDADPVDSICKSGPGRGYWRRSMRSILLYVRSADRR